MNRFDYLTFRKKELELPYSFTEWVMAQDFGPSMWEDIVDIAGDVWDSTRHIYAAGRIAFAAPFIFGAAALFTIADQVDALLFDGIAH